MFLIWKIRILILQTISVCGSLEFRTDFTMTPPQSVASKKSWGTHQVRPQSVYFILLICNFAQDQRTSYPCKRRWVSNTTLARNPFRSFKKANRKYYRPLITLLGNQIDIRLFEVFWEAKEPYRYYIIVRCRSCVGPCLTNHLACHNFWNSFCQCDRVQWRKGESL